MARPDFLAVSLVLVSAGVLLASAQEAPQQLMCDLQVGGAVMASKSTPTFNWALPQWMQTQSSFELEITDAVTNKTVLATGQVLSTSQSYTLSNAALLAPHTLYSWRVRVQASNSSGAMVQSPWSTSQEFFTSLLDEPWPAVPLWATPCPSRDTPRKTSLQQVYPRANRSEVSMDLPNYAYFYKEISLPPTATSVVSALVFVTGDMPLWLSGPKADHKLLGAYRLFLQGRVVGVGPGRSRCMVGEHKIFGCSLEHFYDGFDIRPMVSSVLAARSSPLSFFLSSYGLEQPVWGVAPRVLLSYFLVVKLADGTLSSLQGGTDSTWQSFDADSVYNPTGNSGADFWYFQPHEYINASCIPGMPPNARAEPTWTSPSPEPQLPHWPSVGPRASTPTFVICANASEVQKNSANIKCPVGTVVVSVDFASFGTPTGTCGHFAVGSCNAPLSTAIVESVCLHRNNCSVPSTYYFFAGDPCQGVSKHLYIQVTCGVDVRRCAGCWHAPLVQPSFTVPLVGKIMGPINESFRQTKMELRGPGHVFFDGIQEVQGGVHLQINARAGAPALDGVQMEVRLGEELYGNGSVMYRMRTGNVYRDLWHLTNGSQTLRHHEYMEFRYGELLFTRGGQPVDVPLDWLDVWLWVVHHQYRDDMATKVATSSADLDEVYSLCQYTIKATTLQGYTDSNTRQRSDDCQADDTTAMQGAYASTFELALQRFDSEFDMNIGPVGYLSNVWVDWSILPIINIYNDMLFTGDTTLGKRYFSKLLNHTYLSSLQPGLGLINNSAVTALIDTSGGSQDGFVASPVNSIVNAWVYYAVTTLATIGEWVGGSAAKEAALLRGYAATIKKSFNAYMFNGTAICDGICKLVPHTAVHSSFYALSFGIVADENIKAVFEYVKMRSAPSSAMGMPNGAYPSQFMLLGLYANSDDHGAAALASLTSAGTHSWLGMLAQNATCTMEAWTPEELPNLSHSHPWSASPSFVVPWHLFGVFPTKPAFAEVAIHPQPGSLSHGNMTLPTIRGPLSVGFVQRAAARLPSGRCLTVSVDLPGNTAARVALPMSLSDTQRSSMQLVVDGVPVAASAATPHLHGPVGVRLSGYKQVKVLSGSHSISNCL